MSFIEFIILVLFGFSIVNSFYLLSYSIIIGLAFLVFHLTTFILFLLMDGEDF